MNKRKLPKPIHLEIFYRIFYTWPVFPDELFRCAFLAYICLRTLHHTYDNLHVQMVSSEMKERMVERNWLNSWIEIYGYQQLDHRHHLDEQFEHVFEVRFVEEIFCHKIRTCVQRHQVPHFCERKECDFQVFRPTWTCNLQQFHYKLHQIV